MNYRFYITDALNVTTEVFPTNFSDHTFEYDKRNAGDIVMQVTLDASLKFTNNAKAGNYDYDFIKQKEETALCQEMELRIDKKCGETYVPYWYGLFAPVECKFTVERCLVEFKPRNKEYILGDLKINILDIPNGALDDVHTGSGGSERIYTNCRRFPDVLLYVSQQSNPNIASIVSNFFQINPVVGGTQMLPGVLNNYTQMFFAALSDIQEPIPSNLATKEFISFNELMNDLNVLFDVFWIIDNNYNLRIEHRTYFDGVNGLDLTLPQYGKYLKGKNNYSYDLKDYPKYETWKITGSRQYCRLVYSGCADISKEQNEKVYQTRIINTDYYNIRYNGGGSAAIGLFLFATRQTLGVFRMIESSGQNIMLVCSNLVNKFQRYSRPTDVAVQEYYQNEDNNQQINFNQGEFLAYSVSPTKQGEKIQIPLCCDTVFNYNDKVTTNLGLGYVQKASIKTKTETLELDLKYKTINDNPNITPDQLPGLALWLMCDQGVTIGPAQRVSSWLDYSGNNRHAVQPVLADRSFQFVPGGPISASQGFLKTPAFQLFPGKRGCIIMLYSAGPGITLNAIISTQGGTGNFFDITISPSNQLYNNAYSAAYPYHTISGLLIVNRYADTFLETCQDGYKAVSNPMNIPNTQISSNPLIIGKNAALGGGGQASIYELIIYDQEISDLDRQRIELYLAVKWGNVLNLYTGI